jgi:hypothetical protein
VHCPRPARLASPRHLIAERLGESGLDVADRGRTGGSSIDLDVLVGPRKRSTQRNQAVPLGGDGSGEVLLASRAAHPRKAAQHFSRLEHACRFARTALGWHKAALRTAAQFARWTWIIITTITQLRLARALAADHRHAWERPRKPGRLTPGRVHRDFARLTATAGTPASPPKPSKPGPGRPQGSRSTPATRHDVIKKAA